MSIYVETQLYQLRDANRRLESLVDKLEERVEKLEERLRPRNLRTAPPISDWIDDG
jgi:hypothetical protein